MFKRCCVVSNHLLPNQSLPLSYSATQVLFKASLGIAAMPTTLAISHAKITMLATLLRIKVSSSIQFSLVSHNLEKEP